MPRVERFLDYMQVKAKPRLVKSLKKLDTAVRQRILHKATELADNPYDGKCLEVNSEVFLAWGPAVIGSFTG